MRCPFEDIREHSQGKRYFDCRETFRRSAPGNPEHQKLSGGTIISTAGSHLHLSFHPARAIPFVLPFVRSTFFHPFPRCQSTLHRAQRVFCHHRNYISPFNRFFDRRRRENINIVGRIWIDAEDGDSNRDDSSGVDFD